MVQVRGLRDESLAFEGGRPSGASSPPSSLGLKGPLREDPDKSLDSATKDD